MDEGNREVGIISCVSYYFSLQTIWFCFRYFPLKLFCFCDPIRDPIRDPVRSDPDFVDVATSAWLGFSDVMNIEQIMQSKLNLEIKTPMKQFLRDISALD